MAKIDELCQELVEQAPDAYACGVVDLATGMLVGAYHNVPYLTQSYLVEMAAAATVEFFRGKTVRRMEEQLSRLQGVTVKNALQEIFVASAKTFHYMKVIDDKQKVVVLVTKKSGNPGMGWAYLHDYVERISRCVP